MPQHDIQYLVVTLLSRFLKLCPQLLNVTLSVAHVLLALHSIVAFQCNLFASTEVPLMIFTLIVRTSIHVLQLQLELLFLKLVRSEHINDLDPKYNDAIVNEIENSVRKVFISEVCLKDW